MELTSRIDIDAPPGAVLAVWSDVERWPEWTASVSRIAQEQGRAPGPCVAGEAADRAVGGGEARGRGLIGWLTRSLSERHLRLEAEGLKARSEVRATQS